MPTYDYRCEECGHEFSVTCPISERQVEVECSECGASAKRFWMGGGAHIKWNTVGQTVRKLK